jgi:hypothetical protein
MKVEFDLTGDDLAFWGTLFNDMKKIGEIKDKTFNEFIFDMLSILKENLSK